MARFAPGSAQTIGASLGLGLASAWEYLKRGWSGAGTVRGRTPTLSAVVVGDLPISILKSAKPTGRPGSGRNEALSLVGGDHVIPILPK